jgi:hypothetical protein
MIKLCYTWGKADVLWKEANWKWGECLLVEEVVSGFIGNPPGVPGEWAQPSWLQDEKIHDPYEKEKRKKFIRLICKVKKEKYDEEKLVREDIKISLDDVKMVVKAVKGIDIQIMEE